MKLSVVLVMAVAAFVAACDRQPNQPPLPQEEPQVAAPSTEAQGAAADIGASEAKPYPLDVCIVSDEALGAMGESPRVVYEGQEFKFCCESCIDEFNRNPQEYVNKLQSAKAGTPTPDEAAEAPPADPTT